MPGENEGENRNTRSNDSPYRAEQTDNQQDSDTTKKVLGTREKAQGEVISHCSDCHQ